MLSGRSHETEAVQEWPHRRQRIQTQSRILGHWLTLPLKTRKVQRLNPVPKCSGPCKGRCLPAPSRCFCVRAWVNLWLDNAGQGRCKRGWYRKESQSRAASEKVPGELSVMPSLSARMWPAYSCIVWDLHVKAVDALHVKH